MPPIRGFNVLAKPGRPLGLRSLVGLSILTIISLRISCVISFFPVLQLSEIDIMVAWRPILRYCWRRTEAQCSCRFGAIF